MNLMFQLFSPCSIVAPLLLSLLFFFFNILLKKNVLVLISIAASKSILIFGLFLLYLSHPDVQNLVLFAHKDLFVFFKDHSFICS